MDNFLDRDGRSLFSMHNTSMNLGSSTNDTNGQGERYANCVKRQLHPATRKCASSGSTKLNSQGQTPRKGPKRQSTPSKPRAFTVTVTPPGLNVSMRMFTVGRNSDGPSSSAAASSTPMQDPTDEERRHLIRQHNRIRRECFGRSSKYDEWGPSRDSAPSLPGSEISSGTDFDEHPELVQVVQQLPEYKRKIVAKVLRVKFEKEFPCTDEELATETLRREREVAEASGNNVDAEVSGQRMPSVLRRTMKMNPSGASAVSGRLVDVRKADQVHKVHFSRKNRMARRKRRWYRKANHGIVGVWAQAHPPRSRDILSGKVASGCSL
eukprot:3099838-Amphidinium_carterae.2